MKVLIIDDEAGARSALKGLIELFCPQITKILEAETGAQAIKMAHKEHFDIAFIDIQLKKTNGIVLAQQLTNYCTDLIFVTAHDQHAVEAYKANAIHYLLKPVDPQELQEAVSRAKSRNINEKNASNRLLLPIREGVILLDHEEIIYIHGDGNYCTFHCLDNKRYYVSKHLSFYENLLNSKRFFRIHQSYLINLLFVRQLLTDNGCFAILKNNEQLPVARRRKDDFLKALS